MSTTLAGWSTKTPRQYTAPEREVAFLIYAGQGAHSLRKTAQITGIHRETLGQWAEQDDWTGRLDGAGNAAFQSVELAYAMFPHLLRAASNAWLEILTDPKANANARVKLIELAYGMHGMIVPKQSMAVVQHLTAGESKPTIRVSALADLDPDQLAAFTVGATDDDDDTEG